MKRTYIILMLIAGIAIASIVGPGCRSKMINPNGSSELAVHMRSLNDDALAIREQVLKGGAITVKADPEFILHAEPTEAGKNQRPDYIAYAEAYIHSVELLKEADSENAPMFYTGMVNTCINCHTSMCPGPIVRIKKLHLD